MGGSNGELQDLANRLVDRATAYGMEVSTEKSKIMTNSKNISADITNTFCLNTTAGYASHSALSSPVRV